MKITMGLAGCLFFLVNGLIFAGGVSDSQMNGKNSFLAKFGSESGKISLSEKYDQQGKGEILSVKAKKKTSKKDSNESKGLTAEEKRKKDKEAKDEEKRKKEAEKKAKKEEEDRKKAEAKRIADEKKKAEAERKAEEKKKADAERKAEKERKDFKKKGNNESEDNGGPKKLM